MSTTMRFALESTRRDKFPKTASSPRTCDCCDREFKSRAELKHHLSAAPLSKVGAKNHIEWLESLDNGPSNARDALMLASSSSSSPRRILPSLRELTAGGVDLAGSSNNNNLSLAAPSANGTSAVLSSSLGGVDVTAASVASARMKSFIQSTYNNICAISLASVPHHQMVQQMQQQRQKEQQCTYPKMFRYLTNLCKSREDFSRLTRRAPELRTEYSNFCASGGGVDGAMTIAELAQLLQHSHLACFFLGQFPEKPASSAPSNHSPARTSSFVLGTASSNSPLSLENIMSEMLGEQQQHQQSSSARRGSTATQISASAIFASPSPSRRGGNSSSSGAAVALLDPRNEADLQELERLANTILNHHPIQQLRSSDFFANIINTSTSSSAGGEMQQHQSRNDADTAVRTNRRNTLSGTISIDETELQRREEQLDKIARLTRVARASKEARLAGAGGGHK